MDGKRFWRKQKREKSPYIEAEILNKKRGRQKKKLRNSTGSKAKAKLSNLKIKVVEKSGTKLGTYIKKFDKTNTKGRCQEKDCMICQNDPKNNRKCRTPSLVYKITCKECKKNGPKANYFGESSFNGYTRGVQHLEKYRSKNKATQEKSAMRQHAKNEHNDKKIEYKMTVVRTFKNNPLARQVMESMCCT